MNLGNVIQRDTRPKPPARIDYDRFDLQTTKALFALNKLSKIAPEFRAVPTHEFRTIISSNWPQIWQWLLAFTVGVIFYPQPVTRAGLGRVILFINVAPHFMICPSWDGPDARKLASDILTLSTDLWLYASILGLGRPAKVLIGQAYNSLNICINGPPNDHFASPDESAPFGGPLPDRDSFPENLKSMLILREDAGWDVSSTFITGIISNFYQHPAEVAISLQYLLSFLVSILVSTNLIPIPKLRSKGFIRWMDLLLKKLTAPKSRLSPMEDLVTSSAPMCITRCLQVFEISIRSDAYFAVTALDCGILLRIFNARDFLVMESRNTPPLPDHSIIRQCVVIIQLLTTRLLYRPILVRVIRWMKKIQKLGLDSVDLELPRPFRDAWNALMNEVSQRSSILHGYEAKEGNPLRICQNPD
ncbi:hypothetical protein V5O48_016622, partial [Marasmius crinis-equi]